MIIIPKAMSTRYKTLLISFVNLSVKIGLGKRNVVKSLLWKDSINSPRYGYSVGSPVRLIAACLGFSASSYFSLLTFAFAP